MKTFNLFFSFNNANLLNKIISTLREKYSNDHYDISLDSFFVMDTDNFVEIDAMIQLLYYSSGSETIVLFDGKKDVAYIYQAKGSIDDIKKNILPPMVEMYEIIAGTTVFFEIEDLRFTMMGINDFILN